MDQCSVARHPMSATSGLTNRPGHDLCSGIRFQELTVLTGQPAQSPHPPRNTRRSGGPPLGARVGHRPTLHEPRQPQPGPHQAHRTPTPTTHRGGRTQNPNQLKQNPTTEATRNPSLHHNPGRDLELPNRWAAIRNFVWCTRPGGALRVRLVFPCLTPRWAIDRLTVSNGVGRCGCGTETATVGLYDYPERNPWRYPDAVAGCCGGL